MRGEDFISDFISGRYDSLVAKLCFRTITRQLFIGVRTISFCRTVHVTFESESEIYLTGAMLSGKLDVVDPNRIFRTRD